MWPQLGALLGAPGRERDFLEERLRIKDFELTYPLVLPSPDHALHFQPYLRRERAIPQELGTVGKEEARENGSFVYPADQRRVCEVA